MAQGAKGMICMQHTSDILMIRPVRFDYNAETAVNNHFQVHTADIDIQRRAREEFENFISMLLANGIDVTVVDDTPEPHTPDSVFPNNWISFHEEGSVVLYPMFADNRRKERKAEVLDAIKNKFRVVRVRDLSKWEKENHFLEGTGSMVLDRENKIAYACLSPRTDKVVLTDFCAAMGYRAISFTALDARQQEIYHTNVMMCVADRYVVICMESIVDSKERERVLAAFAETGKRVVEISFAQMDHFAGNMLQVHGVTGEIFLVMSTQAFQSLSPRQIEILQSYNRILHSDITTIETNGGGSARCMMAEIFLSPK